MARGLLPSRSVKKWAYLVLLIIILISGILLIQQDSPSDLNSIHVPSQQNRPSAVSRRLHGKEPQVAWPDDPPELQNAMTEMASGGSPATDGETIRVGEIRSREDLLLFREQRIAEMEEILEETADEAIGTPYYPAVITFLKPLPVEEVDRLIEQYGFKGVHSARFKSSVGGGEFPYYMLKGNPEEIEWLEADIREDRGFRDFRLVVGLTVLRAGIHRESVLELNRDEPKVFLADVGPIEMYRYKLSVGDWPDLSHEIERFP